MSNSEIDRRTFNQLTAAALGGIAAGSLAGCGGEKPAAKPNGPEGTKATAAADVHLCRGLNDCKGKGKGGDNACRGQGACATAKEHACGGMNECKGLGGCGETAGENSCKEQGSCHVPLMPVAWKKLHDKLEAGWKEKKLEYGKAPEKKK
ncbi:MAG: hypothetical protein K8R36_20300 [Planctomycetales bacterium]|nr:hypothetical protein [Planctomycetales bacterium]